MSSKRKKDNVKFHNFTKVNFNSDDTINRENIYFWNEVILC